MIHLMLLGELMSSRQKAINELYFMTQKMNKILKTTKQLGKKQIAPQLIISLYETFDTCDKISKNSFELAICYDQIKKDSKKEDASWSRSAKTINDLFLITVNTAKLHTAHLGTLFQKLQM